MWVRVPSFYMFKEVRRVVWYHILKHYGTGCTATATTPLLQLQLATLSGNRLKVPGAFDQTHTRKDNEMKIYFKYIYTFSNTCGTREVTIPIPRNNYIHTYYIHTCTHTLLHTYILLYIHTCCMLSC